MRLKLDENVDPRAVTILQTAGHDVATVPDEHLSGQPDKAVAETCSREARCFVTLDLDFANVLAYPPERYSGLVVPRHPRPTAAVNAEGSYGRWAYRLVKSPADTPGAIRSAAEEFSCP